MPKYSMKYHNEKNAAAFRHLLGGRVDGVQTGQNQSDLHSSTVHWQLDLRYYNPEKDIGSLRNAKCQSINK